ncbi:hypothetical protein T484DRAFT_1757107, partial [Baffinella frigidus]
MHQAQDSPAEADRFGRTSSSEGSCAPSKELLAQRKKNERKETNDLWAVLEAVTPRVSQQQGQLGNRSKSLRSGRTKQEVLQDVVQVVRRNAAVTGSRMLDSLAVDDSGVGLMTVQLEAECQTPPGGLDFVLHVTASFQS